jgi:transposase
VPTKTKVRLRNLTDEERVALEKLARSRSEEARLVERAQIVLALAEGERPSHVATRLRFSRPKVYLWLKRFNAFGLPGLRDDARSGRPATYTPDEVSQVISAALTKPQELQLPFASWTLDRLQAYLNEQKAIPIKRSRIDEILIAEGLRWRQQESWFGERVDPDFAEKRGASKRSTPPRPSTAS